MREEDDDYALIDPKASNPNAALLGDDKVDISNELEKAFAKIDKLRNENSAHNFETDSLLAEEFEDDDNLQESSQEVGEEIEDEVEEELEDEEKSLSEQKPIAVEKKEKKIDKYRQAQNAKYKALADNASLIAENEQLKTMLNEAFNSTAYQYGKNAYSDLDKARAKKALAIQQVNETLMMEADEEIMDAKIAIENLKSITNKLPQSQQAPQSQGQQQYQPVQNAPVNPQANYQQVVYREIANDWLENHPYLQPSSRNFDSKLASNVWGFVQDLDSELQSTNNMNLYYTDRYFNIIDNHISKLVKKPQDVNKNIESLANVSGVKRGSNPAVRKKVVPPTFTEDEKIIAFNAGITLKDIEKQKRKLGMIK